MNACDHLELFPSFFILTKNVFYIKKSKKSLISSNGERESTKKKRISFHSISSDDQPYKKSIFWRKYDNIATFNVLSKRKMGDLEGS